MDEVIRIDGRRWPIEWPGDGVRLALVDCPGPVEGSDAPLPPYPVIGIGRGDAIWQHLDAIVSDEAAAARLARSVVAMPRAAAVAVQVLRATDAMPAEHALTIESLGFAALQGSSEFAGWRARQPARARADPGQRLTVERHDATLAIRLDWADHRNAIDATMRDALHEAFTLAALDSTITRVTLAAAGRCFSVGGALSEFGTTRDPAEAHRIRTLTQPARAMLRMAARCSVRVQGACIGAGVELAAFAGHVTASPDAWFQLPELAMGLIPGAGGCVSIPNRIGRQQTALMLLSGRRIDAATALRWGLVDEIAGASDA